MINSFNFYQFNLDIAHFYQNIRNDKDKLTKLNVVDHLFYNLFSRTRYSDIIDNAVGIYKPGEPLIYKTPRLIFENLMNHKNLNETKDNEIINYNEIIDKVYSIDKAKNKKILHF